MATGWPMKTTYANGDVYSASDVNDITGTVNLLQTSTLSSQAGKNAIINGGMDIWQRGTSFTTSNNQYTADRLQYYNNGANFTVSRQTSTVQSGFQYYARWQRNAASTSTTASYLGMNLETSNSLRFAGQTVTFSFYARKGADYSGASSNLALNISSGTGTDQNNISGAFTGASSLVNSTATLTTSWTRFTYTVSVGSTATQLGFYWTFTGVGTAGTNDYVDITGIQLELGSYATTFSRAGGSIGGELALCQRYYWRNTPNGGNAYLSSMGTAATTSIADMIIAVPVPMRVIPTVLETSSIRLLDGSNAFSSGTWTLNSSDCSYTYPIIRYTHGSAALTQFRPYFISANSNTAAYIALGAEL